MTTEYFCSHPSVEEYNSLGFESMSLFRKLNKENGNQLLKCTGGDNEGGCSLLEDKRCFAEFDKNGNLAAYWDLNCRRQTIKNDFIKEHVISKKQWKTLSSDCWLSSQKDQIIE